MSTSLTYAGQQIIIYGGITVFITGILGEVFNTIVFLSLRIFRQNSCVFYLIIMSIFNIGQLLTNLLPRIMLTLFNTDGSEYSLFYCKFRLFLSIFCTILSLTCFCLSTIDQYCSTCSYRRLQQLCNIKLARYLIIIFTLFWILHGIPYLIFLNLIKLPLTNKILCTMTNLIYLQYRIYFVGPILFGFLPIFLTVLFGTMAYRNVQQLAYYTMPLVRRELDKQLTIMVLIQVVVNVFVLLPYTIINIFMLTKNYDYDLVLQVQIRFSSDVTFVIYCLYYAVSSIDLK